jgi:hypothetical protein
LGEGQRREQTEDAARLSAEGVSTVACLVIDAAFDYPSQRSGLHHPAEPMLLDTCVLQHLKSVMDSLDGEYLTDEGEEDILRRYPSPLGSELVALGDLAAIFERNGPPWVVSEASLVEFERLDGEKGAQLRQWWWSGLTTWATTLTPGGFPTSTPSL